MPKVLYRVTLTQEERAALQGLATRGNHGSQKVLNALILLGCDEGAFQECKKNRSPAHRGVAHKHEEGGPG